jgi:hypothetical protein
VGQGLVAVAHRVCLFKHALRVSSAQEGDVNDNDHKPLVCPRPIFYDVSAWVFKPQTAPSKEKEIGLLSAFMVTVDDPQNLKVGDIRWFST